MDALKMLQKALQGNAELAGRLARWVFDTDDNTEEPAVFTFAPAPEECGNPVMTLELGDGVDIGARGQEATNVPVMVSLWGDKERSTRELEGLAWAAYRQLHKASLSDDDARYVCRCRTPESVTDDDGYPGYRMQVAVIILG